MTLRRFVAQKGKKRILLISFSFSSHFALVTDLSRNYSVSLFSVEISARGLVTPANRARIKALLFKCCIDAKSITKSMISICSKASLASYS